VFKIVCTPVEVRCKSFPLSLYLRTVSLYRILWKVIWFTAALRMTPKERSFLFSFMFVTTKTLRNTITTTRWVQFPKGKVGHVKKHKFLINFSDLVKIKVNSFSMQWRQVWGNIRTAPVVRNLDARWTWVLFLKHRPLYPLCVHWIWGVVGPRRLWRKVPTELS